MCGERASELLMYVDVPYEFEYGDDVWANKSVLFDLDRVMADSKARRLDYVNWFNRNYGVCVLELILYTPYSDLLTQVLHLPALMTHQPPSRYGVCNRLCPSVGPFVCFQSTLSFALSDL